MPYNPAIMKTAELANAIFDDSVAKYHISDNIDAPCPNPHKEGSLEAIFFEKTGLTQCSSTLKILSATLKSTPRRLSP